MTESVQSVRTRWFVVYTKHQHERTVAKLLTGKGIESFCPTYPTVHRWKDRNKLVELPLFPGYVFFANGLDRRVQIVSTPGVHSIVSFGDAPAEVPQAELDPIRHASEHSMPIEPHPFLQVLQAGDVVRVISGPLAGVKGILQRKRDFYRLILSITMLGRAAAVEIDGAAVEPLSVLNVPPRQQAFRAQAISVSR